MAKTAEMPKDFAQRVVTGACNLSPFLGERMLAHKFLGRSIVVREMMPQDLKLKIDQLMRDEAVAVSEKGTCFHQNQSRAESNRSSDRAE